jgi:hypothetical protein
LASFANKLNKQFVLRSMSVSSLSVTDGFLGQDCVCVAGLVGQRALADLAADGR